MEDCDGEASGENLDCFQKASQNSSQMRKRGQGARQATNSKAGRRVVMTQEERLSRCRERNRVHARNTRERKKQLVDSLQGRLQSLFDERVLLTNGATDNASTSHHPDPVSILMALGGAGADFAGEVVVVQGAEESMGESTSIDFLSLISLPQNSAPKNTLAAMLERVRSQVSAELSDDEDDVEESGHTGAGANPGAGAGTDGTTQKRSKYGCSQSELEKIRRERNRLHARKTRQRKKKMMQEMEDIIRVLGDEVKELRAAKASSVSSSSSCPSVAMPAHSTAGDVRVGARRNHAVGSEREGATPQPQPQPVAESMARKRRCSIVSSVASSRSSSLLSVRSATSLSGMVMDDLVLRAVLGCGKDREQRLQKDQKGISSSSGNLYALARELDCDSADSAAAASLEDERSGCRQASPSPPPKPLELRTVMSFVTVDSLLQLSNNRSSSSSSSNGQLVPVKRTRDGDDETCIRAAQATKFANMGYVFESSSSSSSSGGSEEGDTVVSVSQVQGAYAYAAIHEDSPSF